ncbi:MAG TPA: cytochrome P450 [Myxococcota bacterium]|nr:cytochrome P450 [Myxococcota bacterium]
MSDFSFNPFDEATRRDPFAAYARGRELGAYAHPGLPVLSIFRYADTVAVLRDSSLFSNVFPLPPGVQPEADLPPNMLGTDPPEHERLRGLVNQAFTPKIIRRLEPRMEEIAEQLVAAALEQRKVDLVEALTYPLPVTVIAEIIGVPTEDNARFKHWSDALVSTLGVGLLSPPSPESMAHTLSIVRELGAYFKTLVEERRREPREDLLSGLVAAELEGSHLSFDEMLQMLILLLVAGNETTTTLIGNMVLTLLAHPEELAAVRADPERVPTAIEEVLRFSSPVQMDPRCATADTELCGQKIGKGTIVITWLGSANRDDSTFREPERFDTARRENRHLAFGFGTHYCLGSNLARLEAQTALRVLLRRTRGFRLATSEPLPLHKSIVFRSFTKIPVELEPA